jgi:hypothetical protein
LKPYWWLGLLVILTACQVFQGPDTQATLAAEVQAYATESIAIEQTVGASKLQVQMTAVAAETEVWVAGNINQQLLATARALSPPTQAVVAGIAAEDAVGMMGEGDVMQFAEVVTANSVRQADGCAERVQTQFIQDSARIYVVARVAILEPQTVMGVEWLNEGQLVYADSWVATSGGSDYCVWYFITAEDVAFSPGNWSVRFSAGGQALGSPAPFTIVE